MAHLHAATIDQAEQIQTRRRRQRRRRQTASDGRGLSASAAAAAAAAWSLLAGGPTAAAVESHCKTDDEWSKQAASWVNRIAGEQARLCTATERQLSHVGQLETARR